MKWITRETVKVDRVALGLSDREILEREFIVYDALRAECQRRAASKAARLARVLCRGYFCCRNAGGAYDSRRSI